MRFIICDHWHDHAKMVGTGRDLEWVCSRCEQPCEGCAELRLFIARTKED